MDKKKVIVIDGIYNGVNILELSKILKESGYETITVDESIIKKENVNLNAYEAQFKLDDIKYLLKDQKMLQNNDLWYQSKKFKKPKY